MVWGQHSFSSSTHSSLAYSHFQVVPCTFHPLCVYSISQVQHVPPSVSPYGNPTSPSRRPPFPGTFSWSALFYFLQSTGQDLRLPYLFMWLWSVFPTMRLLGWDPVCLVHSCIPSSLEQRLRYCRGSKNLSQLTQSWGCHVSKASERFHPGVGCLPSHLVVIGHGWGLQVCFGPPSSWDPGAHLSFNSRTTLQPSNQLFLCPCDCFCSSITEP